MHARTAMGRHVHPKVRPKEHLQPLVHQCRPATPSPTAAAAAGGTRLGLGLGCDGAVSGGGLRPPTLLFVRDLGAFVPDLGAFVPTAGCRGQGRLQHQDGDREEEEKVCAWGGGEEGGGRGRREEEEGGGGREEKWRGGGTAEWQTGHVGWEQKKGEVRLPPVVQTGHQAFTRRPQTTHTRTSFRPPLCSSPSLLPSSSSSSCTAGAWGDRVPLCSERA
jgi:hypothetical protein